MPLRQIIKDTKRTDFYLDAPKALEYGLIDAIVAGELPEPKPMAPVVVDMHEASAERPARVDVSEPATEEAPAARETAGTGRSGGTARSGGTGVSGKPGG